jgi:formate dehydrogenase maturation protein FdhE
MAPLLLAQLTTIDRPSCPHCGEREQVVVLESGHAWPELQCLQCEKCDYLWGVVDDVTEPQPD